MTDTRTAEDRGPAPSAGSAAPPASSFLLRGPVMDLVAAAFVVALFAAGTWASYWAEHRNDQYQLLQLGRCVHDGGRMYVDCWENKPPGLAWLNTLGLVLTGGNPFGAWALPGLTGLGCVAAVWFAALRLYTPTTGRRTAGFAAFLFSMRLYDGASINPDFYCGMFAATAGSISVAAVYGRTPANRIGLGLASGLLWAAATCVKQTGCVGVAVLSLVCVALLLARAKDRGPWLAATGGAWAGFAAGAGVVLAVLSRQQTLTPAWDAVFSFNRSLLTWDTLCAALGSDSRLRIDLGPLALPLWVGMFGLVVTLLVGTARQVGRTVVITAAIWWIVEVVLALMGPSHTMRYWQGMFAPLVILGAAGLFHIEEVFRQLRGGYKIAFVLVSATVMMGVGRPFFQAYRLGLAESYLVYDDPNNERSRLAEVGRQVQELVPPGERIYVLAYQPGIYVHAQRSSASRFTYPRSTEQMREILAELSGGKAYAVLVPIHPAPEFHAFCDEECRRNREAVLASFTTGRPIGDFQVFVRPQESGPGGR